MTYDTPHPRNRGSKGYEDNEVVGLLFHLKLKCFDAVLQRVHIFLKNLHRNCNVDE